MIKMFSARVLDIHERLVHIINVPGDLEEWQYPLLIKVGSMWCVPVLGYDGKIEREAPVYRQVVAVTIPSDDIFSIQR